MKGVTTVIILGVGGSIGFVAGNVFLATKVLESETMRHALSDIIAEKISKTGFGESKNKRPIRVSYNDYYRTYRSPRYNDKAPNEKYRAEDLIFATRGDAEETFSKMEQLLEQYGVVTVADFYELAGFSDNPEYQSSKFGWTNLKTASVNRVREGYTIELPLANKLK